MCYMHLLTCMGGSLCHFSTCLSSKLRHQTAFASALTCVGKKVEMVIPFSHSRHPGFCVLAEDIGFHRPPLGVGPVEDDMTDKVTVTRSQ